MPSTKFQRRWLISCLGFCLLVFLVVSTAVGQQPASRDRNTRSRSADGYRLAKGRAQTSEQNTSANTPDGKTKQVYIREGHEITNEVGVFQVKGDNVTFESVDEHGQPDGRLNVGVLQNLNLERILDDSDHVRNEKATWVISGTITEYKKLNFVLITRVMKKSATASSR